jgi:HK97 family phage major capsid protein
LNRIQEIETRKAELLKESEQENADLAKIKSEMESLNAELVEIRKAAERKKIADMMDSGDVKGTEIETRKGNEKVENKFESIEYRKAFMAYVTKGAALPVEYRDASAMSDVGAVIPQVIVNQIIEKAEQYGNILPLVRRLAYPAGVVVPTSVLAATGRWINDGDTVQKEKKAVTKITFGAYELAASIGVTFAASVMSLSVFENAVIENVTRAMVKALEQAIISGDGNGKPTGIINTEVDAKQKVALSASLSFKDIINVFKAIPAAYSAGVKIFMNESTFYDFLAITDNNGQPVARVNYGVDGAPARSLFGRQIVTTDYLPSLDAAKAGETVAFAFDPQYYVLNTAYNMDMVRYVDNDTRTNVFQSVAIVDGKVVDANGLVLVNKNGTKV